MSELERKYMDTHPLEALSERYLMSSDFSQATLNSYRIAFKHFIVYLKVRGITYATTRDVIDYREEKRMKGNSTYYIHIQICALRGLYRYLKSHQTELDLPKEYAYDIMTMIRNEKIKKQLTRPVLTLEEAKHLILETKRQRKSIGHFRDHAIISLMLVTGVKVEEIVHAKRYDYEMKDGITYLHIPWKKTNGPMFVKIPKGVKESIDDYLSKRKDLNPYLFISHKNVTKEGHLGRMFFCDMFPRVLKEVGLESTGVTPHGLRHTAAHFNLLRGASIEQTQALLRHQNIQSTLVYQEHLKRQKDDSEHQIEAYILKEDGIDLEYSYFLIIEESE
jgi:integrase/recombinase XerD